MNNQIYGITQQFQDTHFESRYEACGPKGYNPPDFIKIATAYGLTVMYISRQEGVRRCIRAALDYPKAIICDVNMKHWHTYEPRVIGWDTPIEDMTPKLSRGELKANML